MASSPVITIFLIALVLARVHFSACQVVKGKLSCLDCTQNYDFSGIKVAVSCKTTRKMFVTTADYDGSFLAETPIYHSNSPPSTCLAKLLGGPTQLYASRTNMVSAIVNSNDPTAYTVSMPLRFSTSCPNTITCDSAYSGSVSKTVDLPLPPEWGLAPSSYYFPFVPIIGIP